MYERESIKSTKIISYDVAAEMTFMLKKVITSGTGRGASIGREAAGKTGTTDDYRDAWFVGYTPNLVTGVWVGNDDNAKMPGITGGNAPARIWRSYMTVATKNFANSVFDYPFDKEYTKTSNEDVEIEENVDEIPVETQESVDKPISRDEYVETPKEKPAPNINKQDLKKPFDVTPLPGE